MVQMSATAGYPNGFDAGELVPIPPFFVVLILCALRTLCGESLRKEER